MNTFCKFKYFIHIFLFIIVISISAQNDAPYNIYNEEILTSSNLPLIFINTNGQIIESETRITANMGIIDNGTERNFISDEFNEYDGLISIELRGSSSAAYPKPQFRFETQDTLGENLNISLCGLPTENDWILNGPYNDRSLVRNFISYQLSNKIGRYASRTVFCELILNEEYLGLYLLMEKIKRDNDRIDITKISDTDNEGDELTGGYIVKIDKFDGENVGYWLSNKGTPYQYHFPKNDEITQAQKEYIRNYFNEFESLMEQDDISYPSFGYSTFIDVDSFVDHFILNEFCKNVDAYRLSAFLYKDRDSVNPKLFAGPIWDFNLTFGDAWIPEEIGFFEGWQVDYSIVHPDDPFKVPFWWRKLSRDNDFVNKISARWWELRNTILSIDSLYITIDNTVHYIDEASKRNFERWPEVLTITHDQEILRLKGWILQRLGWIDRNLEMLSNVKEETRSDDFNKIRLYQNYPNPFNPSTKIKYTIPAATINITKEHRVVLSVYDINGRNVAILLNKKQKPGSYEIEFNPYNKGLNLSSGIYFYRITTEDFILTRKMILIK